MIEPGVMTSKGAVVRTFSMQVVINCTCGVQEPILVHFIPDADLKTSCPGCRSVFYVAKVLFDGTKVQLAVAMSPPNIITPIHN